MEEKLANFRSLVSQLSDAERQELLAKMRPLEGDPDSCSLERKSNPDMGSDVVVIEDELKSELIFYRIYIWIRAIFSGLSKETVYNADKITALYKKVDKNFPGLIDYKRGFLLNIFYEKVQELKKAADFFRPYIDVIFEDIGAYYVFMGSCVLPEITTRMNDEVDPCLLPLDREVTGELRTSLLRKMDDIFKDISGGRRSFLYSCARGVEWFRQFVALPFDRLLSKFSNGMSGSYVASFEDAANDLNAFSHVMCNGNNIPPDCLESIYLFSAKKMVPLDSEATDDDGRAREFMSKASSFMSVIRMFIDTVQLQYINKIVFNNIQWSPDEFGGAENWFVKYKEHWKKLFDEKWNQWLKDRKKQKLHNSLVETFGLEDFPHLPDRPWTRLWGGIPFHFEMTAGFLSWFILNKFNDVMTPLKNLSVEGAFINSENRTEFNKTLNDMVSVADQMHTFLANMSPMGEDAIIFDKFVSSHMRSLQAQQKIDSIMLTAEQSIQNIKNAFCDSSRILICLLNGALGDKSDTRYDGVSNLSKIQGGRAPIEKARNVLSASLEMLKELEGVDIPGPSSVL